MAYPAANRGAHTHTRHTRPSPRRAAHLLDAAKQRLGGGAAVQGVPRGHRAARFFQAGIEQHAPEPGRYDVIWLQWAALYLTDGAAVPGSRGGAAG